MRCSSRYDVTEHTPHPAGADRVAGGCSRGGPGGRPDRAPRERGAGQRRRHRRTGRPRPEISASWRRVRGRRLAPGGEPAVAPLVGRRGRGAGVRRSRAGAAAAAAARVARARRRRRPARGRVRHRRAGAVAARAARRAAPRRPARLRRRVGLDRGQRRHQRDRDLPGRRASRCRSHGAEHYVERTPGGPARPRRSTTRGPATVLGAVDVSGPAPPCTPLDAGARRTPPPGSPRPRCAPRTSAACDRLRAYAAPLLARRRRPRAGRRPGRPRRGGTGFAAPGAAGRCPPTCRRRRPGCPTLGAVAVEPLPGGWLVPPRRRGHGAGHPARARPDRATPQLRVTTPSDSWAHAPTPRHAEILLALARHPEGRSAAELADDLFGDPTRVGHRARRGVAAAADARARCWRPSPTGCAGGGGSHPVRSECPADADGGRRRRRWLADQRVGLAGVEELEHRRRGPRRRSRCRGRGRRSSAVPSAGRRLGEGALVQPGQQVVARAARAGGAGRAGRRRSAR